MLGSKAPVSVPRIMEATAGDKAFSYKATQLWTRLPISVQDSEILSILKVLVENLDLF